MEGFSLKPTSITTENVAKKPHEFWLRLEFLGQVFIPNV